MQLIAAFATPLVSTHRVFISRDILLACFGEVNRGRDANTTGLGFWLSSDRKDLWVLLFSNRRQYSL